MKKLVWWLWFPFLTAIGLGMLAWLAARCWIKNELAMSAPNGQLECDVKDLVRHAGGPAAPAHAARPAVLPFPAAAPTVAAPAAEFAIQTRGLAKRFTSPWTLRVKDALSGLDLDVPRGEVIGYLGPNGAGKTTTIKLLAGLLRPSAGEGWLLGEPLGLERSRRSMGYLPEQPYFYDWLTGVEFLELMGRLSGLGAHDASERARRWLGRVGLGERSRLPLRKYSKGMLQRVGMAAALIHEPELLILDEPMSGLDPFGRRDVRELILEQRQRGVTVLLSSHILPDVEMLCDRVAVLMSGRLVGVGTVNELVDRQQQRVEIRCVGAPIVEVPARWRDRLARSEHPEGTTFVLDDEREINDVLTWLIEAGARLRAVTPQRATLEDLFVSLTAPRDEAQPLQRTA